MLLYVPGLECSTKDAPLHSSILESTTPLPLTWNGKPLQPRSLSRSWKQASWLRRLFGLTLPPSTRDLGVEKWIASLADSLASPIASPASAKASKTSAGSGTTSSESFATLVHGAWCSKMSADFFRAEEWVPYSQAFPVSGSLSNGQLFQRERLALRTGGSESSSWPTPNTMPEAPNGGLDRGGGAIRARTTPQGLGDLAKSFWPTARAEDSESCGNHPGATDSLTGATRNWPTPTVTSCAQTAEDPTEGQTGGTTLPGAVQMWPTPDTNPDGRNNKSPSAGAALRPTIAYAARDWQTPAAADGQRQGNYGRGAGNPTFPEQAAQWMAPDVPNGDRTLSPEVIAAKGSTESGKKQVGLENQVKLWLTPKTPTGGANSKREDRGAGGADLQEQVENWPSPMTRDYRGGGASLDAQRRQEPDGHARLEGGELFAPGPGDARWGDVISAAPWLAPALGADKRRLNPRFAEWLMGWPIGWTEDHGKQTSTSEQHQQSRHPQACAARGIAEWRALLQVRLDGLVGPAPSGLLETGGSGNPLPALPSVRGCDRWNMGIRSGHDGDLRDMQDGVSAEALASIETLRQPGMPQAERDSQCAKAMENRRDRLRAVGNGVVPLQAAAAVVGLIRRLTA